MDKLTLEQRRKCMQANKSRETKPELILAKALRQVGFHYRKNSKKIFGKPDFSSKKYKIAIFVDGEFWHGKNWENRKADFKTNKSFWIAKIESNMRRDIEVTNCLKSEGWTVFRFWAKEVVKNSFSFAEIIERTIYEIQLRNNQIK